MKSWLILTGEYPPQHGGVSDYTAQLAQGLVGRGDEVHVFAPAVEQGLAETSVENGVVVHRLVDCFGRRGRVDAAKIMKRLADRSYPVGASRVLVQYVPHAFGCRAMNLAFVLWVGRLAPRPIDVLFHEVAYPFELRQKLRRHVLAGINRIMAAVLGRAADRVFVSTSAWRRTLRPLVGRRQIRRIAVSSNLPVAVDHAEVRSLRAILLRPHADKFLVGHFGTFGELMTPMLRDVVDSVLRTSGRRVLLIGRGGREFAKLVVRDDPSLGSRVIATGGLEAEAAALHLAACDVLVQPYPDGISGRRCSALAGLALGLPVVTNAGHSTEGELWPSLNAVSIARSGSGKDIAAEVEHLLLDNEVRVALAARAASVYRAHFSLDRALDELRDVR